MIVLEILFEVVFKAILVIPGAFIRWGVFGFKKNFKDVINDNIELNSFIGIIALIGIIILVNKFQII